MSVRRAWVGLGGNVGDVPATFASALADLASRDGIRVVRVSALYRTPAWGVTDQPDFVNAVAELASVRRPDDLLSALQGIERANGRDRTREQRWGPRTLDLDLLAMDGVSLDTPDLQLPHPRLSERAFVLVPWAEIAPDVVLPGLGRIDALAAALDRSGIEAIP
ncbi:2-amino-4-hydroxy-6-hydroxymethyldihydropteridine diphosphokinase [Silanimonas algicola]